MGWVVLGLVLVGGYFALLTALVWLLGILVGLGVQLLAGGFLLAEALSREKLGQLLSVSFDDHTLKCRPVRDAIEELVGSYHMAGVGMSFGIATAVVTTAAMVENPTLMMWKAESTPEGQAVAAVVGGICSLLIVVTVLSSIETHKHAVSLVEANIKRLTARADYHMHRLLEVDQFAGVTKDAATRLAITFDPDYLDRIRAEFLTDPIGMLKLPSNLSAIVERELERARADSQSMVACEREYAEAWKLYHDVRWPVFATRQTALIDLLSEVVDALTAGKQRLVERNWSAFRNILRVCDEHLQELGVLARTFAQAEPAVNGDASTEDPYVVLRVTADMEREKVRKVYLALVAAYHPDTQGDAEEMTRINLAYEQICKQKGWTS